MYTLFYTGEPFSIFRDRFFYRIVLLHSMYTLKADIWLYFNKISITITCEPAPYKGSA